MANFYQGQEVKFKLDITADGFSMDNDPFDVQVTSGRTSVSGSKAIAYDSENDQTAKQGSAEVCITKSGEDWWVVVKTDTLAIGSMRVIITAHVTDTSAYDGVRNDISVNQLGTLVKP
jgi:hypothetical protein